MTLGRIVYDGPTALGHRVIREGDHVEFRSSIYESTRYEGYAFFSSEYTRNNAITMREPNYDYRGSLTDCHSHLPSNLVSHILKEPRKSGFGKWIKEHG